MAADNHPPASVHLAVVLSTLAFGVACQPDVVEKLVYVEVEDEGCQLVEGFSDVDGDGFGTGPGGLVCLEVAESLGLARRAGDCDDYRSAVFPGAPEACNERDDDCDGLVDAADPDLLLEGPDLDLFYQDADGDGAGDPATEVPGCGEPPEGWTRYGVDCDDANADAYLERSQWRDADGDGFGSAEATERVFCGLVEGYSLQNSDCDDTNPEVHEDAVEVCNGIDDDCDRRTDVYDDSLPEDELIVSYRDGDGDGFGDASRTHVGCEVPSGYVDHLDGGHDCIDFNAAVHPGASESCNGIDADCDGIDGYEDPDTDPSLFSDWYPDTDGDGYGETSGLVTACRAPSFSQYVLVDGDCDETDSDINPGEAEVCNGLDDDCNGLADTDDPGLLDGDAVLVWPDGDGDGYGDPSGTSRLGCDVPSGYALLTDDCDDGDSSVRPDTSEVCDNGVDDDCDGVVDDCSTPTVHVLEWNGSSPVKPVEGVADSELGRWIMDGGDVDGDGLVDVMVLADGRGLSSTSAYLLYGATSWASDWTTPSLTITSASAEGTRIVGDWNGDGYDDLALPEQSTFSATDFTWIPGGPSLAGTTTSSGLLSSGDASLFFESSVGFSITGVGPAGDLDFDGYDDLWVYGADSGTGYDGVWLLMGSASVGVMQTDFLDHAAARLEEASTHGARYDYGDGLSFGDLDGDGLGDAAWGHRTDNRDGTDVGQVYVWLGVVEAGASAGGIPLGYDWMLGSDQPGDVDGLGELVQVVGDVDSDGYDDLLVASDEGHWTAGPFPTAWLIYGATSLSGRAVVEDADATFDVASYRTNDLNPVRGDVNSDGVDDLVVLGDGYDASATVARGVGGLAAVIEGGTRLSGAVDLREDADWLVVGQGSSLANPDRMVIGDVDGSGASDLVFSSYRHQSDYVKDGALFVLPDFAE